MENRVRLFRRPFTQQKANSPSFNKSISKCTSLSQLEHLLLLTSEFKPVHCIVALNRIGQLHSKNREIVAKILLASENARDFTPNVLCSLFHLLAKYQFTSTIPSFLFAKFHEIPIHQYNAWNFSNVVWSLAKFSPSANTESKAICHKIVHEFLSGNPSKVRELTSQGISNLAWGFAKLNCFPPKMAQRIAHECLHHRGDLQAFNLQELSTLLWSLAQHHNNHQFSDILPLVQKMVLTFLHTETFSMQVMTNTLTALTLLKHRDTQLLNAFAMQILDGRVRFALPQEVSVFLHSFAQLNYEGELKERLCIHCAQHILSTSGRGFSVQTWAACLWSFSCLHVLDLPQVIQVFNLPPIECDAQIFSHHGKQLAFQFFQIHLAWKQQTKESTGPVVLKNIFDNNWVERMLALGDSASASDAQLVLFHKFKLYFKDQPFCSEDRILNRGISVDMHLPLSNVVIEVDGPFHFLSDGTSPTGSTVFKRRLIRNGGYTLFPLHLVEYDKLSQAEQDMFLMDFVTKIKVCRQTGISFRSRKVSHKV